MKKVTLWISLVTAILIGGCNKNTSPKTFSNMDVKTTYSTAANYPAGTGYAIVNLPSAVDPDSEEARIEQRIQTALANELTSKGYKPVNAAEAQFYVAWSLQVKQDIDVLAGMSDEPGNEWIAVILTPEEYVGGALMVQIMDARKKMPVWLGVFNANVELTDVGEQEKKERIAFAMRELLKSFPPK